MATKQGSRYNIEALSKGLKVLGLFTAGSPTLTLSQIVAALDVNKSTIFRILSTLEDMGYLERDPTTRLYRPSLSVLQLGFTAMNGLEVRQVARPHLEKLADEISETASLGVLRGTEVIYVDRVGNRAIVGLIMDAGSRLPAHCTTLGKVFLANMAPDRLDKFLEKAGLRKYTPRTISDPWALCAKLPAIRRCGYAVCDGELAVGLRAAGAPVHDNSGGVVAAVNVSGSSLTITQHRLKREIVPAVVRTAANISLGLGYNPEAPVRGPAPGIATVISRGNNDPID